MKSAVVLFLLSVALLIVMPFVARAEPTAWMSLSRTEILCDIDELPPGPVWVNIRLDDIDDYAGARVMVAWGSENLALDAHCYELVMVDVPIGEGSDCTWMNRGWAILDVDTVECKSGYCSLWFDFTFTEPSPCSGGNSARLLFDFSGCSGDEAGHICLIMLLTITGGGWVGDEPNSMSSIIVLGGGDTECPCCTWPECIMEPCPGCKYAGTDVRTTWGRVKAMYR